MGWVPATATPSFVGARVTKSSNQTLTTATATAVTFDGEAFDTDAFHSTVSSTTRLTIPAGHGGTYLVGGSCEFIGNADDNPRYVHLRLNGGSSPQYGLGRGNAESGGSAGPQTFVGTVLLDLSAGDYVEMFARQDSGGDLDVAGGSLEPTIFWIVKVGV